jgi:hypothetical protein
MNGARNNQQYMTLEKLDSLNRQLEESTTNTVKKIEKFVGSSERFSSQPLD